MLGALELGLRQLRQDYVRFLAELALGADSQPSWVRLVPVAPRLPGRPELLLAAFFRWERPSWPRLSAATPYGMP
jgi:hypothetical protein